MMWRKLYVMYVGKRLQVQHETYGNEHTYKTYVGQSFQTVWWVCRVMDVQNAYKSTAVNLYQIIDVDDGIYDI